MESARRKTLVVTKTEQSLIHVGEDALSALGAWIAAAGVERVAILADEAVKDRVRALPFAEGAPLIPLIAAESQKTLATVSLVLEAMEAARCNRRTALIAIGGGITLDIGGLCAALYHRGMPFLAVPTTALAMVDAAVGGKNGVHLPRAKNAVGTIRQPDAVFVDPSWLLTLPAFRWREGLAEMLKIAAIADAEAFAAMEREASTLALGQPGKGSLVPFLAAAIERKAAIVESDAFESGRREHLNYGHTVGHAIETATDFAIPHGQAVALGLLVENELGAVQDRFRIAALIEALQLAPPWPRGLGPESLWPLMERDKKARAGRVRIAVPKTLGSGHVLSIQRTDLEQALQSLSLDQAPPH